MNALMRDVMKAMREEVPGPSQTEIDISEVCGQVREMLIEKNRSYGDSALNPVRIFSKAPADAAIEVRIDDKLSRISSGKDGAFGEDVINDLLGYLVLLKIARKRKLAADTAPM